MTANEIIAELSALGRESYKRIICDNHGVKEPCFGVPIAELKKIQKRIRIDHHLALELYNSGNYDAMYLAGLIADDTSMTREDLQHWVERAYGGALPGSTVPWVAAGSPHGREMALKWIESEEILVAMAGWATMSSRVSIINDADLDLAELERLMERIRRTIHDAPDAVRYQMNGFIIAVGCHVSSLSELALKIAETIGPVTANLGNNDCQIPSAPDSIRKVKTRGAIGRKRKSAKC